jgi:protein-S-isoprenylcysteine O-methyltransferase Ste14
VLIAGWTKPYIERGTTSLAWLLVNIALWVSEGRVWLHSRTGATRAAKGNLWIPLACLAPGFAVFVLAPTIAPSADIRPAGVAFAAGISILVAGLLLRGWAMQTLGRYFTGVAVTRPDQPVVTSGPFRIVRHPGYTGGVLEGLGAGIAWGN